MSKRYGRNQRRRARENEATLIAQRNAANDEAYRLKRQIAQYEGIEAEILFAKKHTVQAALKELGLQLSPHAERLLTNAFHRVPPMVVSVDQIPDAIRTTRVTAEIKPVVWCYQVEH